MFERINDLTIEGGCFINSTTLRGIFQERLNIVYGPNGSGKSTVSRAMAHLSDELSGKVSNSFDVKVDFDEVQKNELKGRLYVYNEDFVDKNVKIEGDLDGIIMLGEDNIENDDKKKNIQGSIDDLNRELVECKDELYGNPTKSIKGLDERIADCKKALEKSLKAEGGFAPRGRDIKGQANRLTVNIESFDNINSYSEEFGFNLTDIASELANGIKECQKLQGGEKIIWDASIDASVDCELIDRLLKKTIQKIELDEDWLQELAETSIATIEAAQHGIVEKNLTRCPYCQQPITMDWMETLKGNIARVLNKDVDMFKSELDSAISDLNELEQFFPDAVSKQFVNEVNAIRLALKNRNSLVMEFVKQLDRKKHSLYVECDGVDTGKYSDCMLKLKEATDDLNNKIKSYNDAVDDSKNRKARLLKLNEWLGYLENKSGFEEYKSLKERKPEVEKRIGEIVKDIKGKEAEILRLNSGRENSTMAMEFINDCLNMAFFDGDRLHLEQSDDPNKYRLTSRGLPLPPKNVSVGERNVLALAYFYASLLEMTSLDRRFDVERFIVIDDPVSSFDKGNMLGVICLFRDMIERLLTEKDYFGRTINKNSCKFLIMSHDRQTIKYFEAKREEHFSNIKTKELKNQRNVIEIVDYNVWDSDYKESLTRLLHFATDESYKEDEVNFKRVYSGIGNDMRQALESFAKLNYNSDCKSILYNDHIWREFRLNNFNNESPQNFEKRKDKLKEGLKKTLLRVALNESSHSATNQDNLSTEHLFGIKEIRDIARSFLVYIDRVAYQHSIGYLRRGDAIGENERKDVMNKLVREVSEQFYRSI